MAFHDSFTSDDGDIATGPLGQRVHRDALDHSTRLEPRLWEVRAGVWCFVGNGLSNQTFIEAPDGLIVIDTGECNQEMEAALAAVREHTDAPIGAVIYSHFHYVGGTRALIDAGAPDDLEVWGHRRIVANRARYGLELSAAAGRGIVHQFGMGLPDDGEDALVNVGLGRFFRNPDHAPFTEGFVAPNEMIADVTRAQIAGLTVELTPAPSDADDNVTIWFPDLGVCVNNLVWPALFNVFAIRGEEYRDPRVLLTGLDHIVSLGAEHLVGAHGPPLSGADRITAEVTAYRDSIQFLWDQTVRGINRGLTMDELTEFVQLPERFGESYLTRQFYGLVEHHVRQIHTGLRGWFDGDEASLLPVPHVERHRRLIEGFGGREVVLAQSRDALDRGDLRWALELATWLVRSEADAQGRADGGSETEREQLAAVLRAIGQRTTAANIRNWCLVRARELEGAADLGRHRRHRFSAGAVGANPLSATVHALRVLLDPDLAAGMHAELRFELTDGQRSGLRLRDGVAVPTDGTTADLSVSMEPATWTQLASGRLDLSDAIESGAVTTGDPAAVRAFFRPFDHDSLAG